MLNYAQVLRTRGDGTLFIGLDHTTESSYEQLCLWWLRHGRELCESQAGLDLQSEPPDKLHTICMMKCNQSLYVRTYRPPGQTLALPISGPGFCCLRPKSCR